LQISGAAMDIHAGSYQDPPGFAGLAHFHEHMLFLGTAKYPGEDAYESYLSAHGGSSNAFTSDEQTNYYFDVTAPHLEGMHTSVETFDAQKTIYRRLSFMFPHVLDSMHIFKIMFILHHRRTYTTFV
jgi:hypothetical protein